MKGRLEIFSSEPESKFPNEAYSDVLAFLLNSDMMKSNFRLCLQSVCVCTSKRPQVKMPPKLVKTFPLKRLQIITGKIGKNLIIFFKLCVAKWVCKPMDYNIL